MLRSQLHGPAYCTPALAQGDFAPPHSPVHAEPLPPDAKQGEAEDWFEVSRYGAFLSPALVSPVEYGGRKNTTLKVTGYISTQGNPPQLHVLLPAPTSRLARLVWSGSFLALASPFFLDVKTMPIEGYVVSLEQLDSPPLDSPSTTGPSPTPASPVVGQPSTVAKPSGPHSAPLHKFQAIPKEKVDIRKLGYTNLRGVLRG
ncbi:hypothetical protein C8R45DRAFT_301894 [Mycena sanguinolenta]|nr:hypothetical protein C8R45DRAFT_301894 [Mycena sanguinolenta]